MSSAIITKHKLDFEVAKWALADLIDQLAETMGIRLEDDNKYPEIPWMLFRVGTCEGQWRCTDEAYEILSVINKNPGNGHLDDLLEWFEYACKRQKLPLRILSFTNEKFKQHLITKRGFKLFNKNDVEINYHKNKRSYHELR